MKIENNFSRWGEDKISNVQIIPINKNYNGKISRTTMSKKPNLQIVLTKFTICVRSSSLRKLFTSSNKSQYLCMLFCRKTAFSSGKSNLFETSFWI